MTAARTVSIRVCMCRHLRRSWFMWGSPAVSLTAPFDRNTLQERRPCAIENFANDHRPKRYPARRYESTSVGSKLCRISPSKDDAMDKRIITPALIVATMTVLAIGLAGQGTAPGLQLVTRAAEALGGRERVMAVKTLQVVGYGELAYFNGGGNNYCGP